MKLLARAFPAGLFLMTGLLFAPLRADDAPAPVTDPAQIANHYHEVVARPVFQQTEEIDLTARMLDELSQWLRDIEGKIGDFKITDRLPAFESLLMTLMVVFCFAVLIYIAMRLFRRRARIDSMDEPAVPGQKAFRPPAAYDQEIRDAIRAGDWHAAWLAAWRQFLSRLEDRQMVEADRTQTNREYLAQLRDRALPVSALTLLAGLVDAYDRFIYGRKAIAETDWLQFSGQIHEAGLLLHLEDNGTRAPAKARTP